MLHCLGTLASLPDEQAEPSQVAMFSIEWKHVA